MKPILPVIAALLFSTLFYGQHMGINLSFFSLITIIMLVIQHPKTMRLQVTLVFTSVYLLTAVLVFFNHSTLSVIANCAAFFTLIGTLSESRSSLYIRWINGIYSTVAGYFQRKLDPYNKNEQQSWKNNNDLLHLAKLIGIPLVVIIVFTLLYKNGNPVFADFIGKINFEFINFQWILFSVLGYFLFENSLSPVKINPVTNADLETNNELQPSQPLQETQLKKEQQLGTLLMGLLNVLLIFYCFTDVYDLLTNDISFAPALSSQVHNGINALIASIIIAILIILYFFRGNLNFYKSNGTLKKLSYTWIILNISLVILIAFKNHNYVTTFGFTYKRIGVFIYLFLTLAGLVTTYLKVQRIRNLWFLFRINTQVAFALLIVSSCVDWDHAITNFNLKYASNLDLNYLINLTDNNAVLLQSYADKHPVLEKYNERIHLKYINFVNTVTNRNWQEWTYENIKITKN